MNEGVPNSEVQGLPVFVDLDHTLVRTDLLYESFLVFFKTKPYLLWQVLIWLLQGRAILKQQLARAGPVDVTTLPYETELMAYLEEKKRQGCELILATASHQQLAQSVAEHLGIFDAVLASGGGRNLKGRSKLDAIVEYTRGGGFIYAGDSPADRPIWARAERAVFVNAPQRDIDEALAAGKVEHIIRSSGGSLNAFVKEMRLHQWAKNILIFIPLIASHQYMDPSAVFAALGAFITFGFCASGVYFWNDLLDLEADRQHQRKCSRPLASGNLSIPLGLFGACLLPLIGLIGAWLLLPAAYTQVLLVYLLVTTGYSFYLKSKSTIDVMTLALLYTLRVVAGSVVIAAALSSWLLGFSIFLFVSLAYLKRYVEVSALSASDGLAKGRGYSSDDGASMFMLGIANMTASVLLLALYISSEEIRSQYAHPQLLWGLCLLLLYWGNRIWLGAKRGKVTDDPVVFAIKDGVSRMVAVLFLCIVLTAMYWPTD